jgi:hypothetical protein
VDVARRAKNMTVDYAIVKTSARHLRPMSRHLRAAACITLQGFGLDPRIALHRAFMASHYCRTATIDEKPVAMWGVKGTLLGDGAFVWLVLSDQIAAVPRAVMREAKAELARVMDGYDEIAITVLPDDIAAVRFAVWLGFHDRDNDDGHLSRKALTEAIIADPVHRLPIGDRYVIALGYHPESMH